MTIEAAAVHGQVFDTCVVGTGPAGLTLAMELCKLRPDWRVLVLEYGFDASNVDDLNEKIVISNHQNHHPPEECTNKGFGGTSQTWGGRCVAYDEIDFLKRPVIGEDCTWGPELLTEIQVFYKSAAKYMECGDPVFNLNEIEAVPKRRISENFVEGEVTDSVLERWSLPTRYNSLYRTEVEQMQNLLLLDGIKVTKIRAKSGVISKLEAVDRRSGASLDILANRYVLAAGAQESTRLLLKSDEVFSTKAGRPPSLGLYYQGHISGKIASIKFTGDPKRTDFGFFIDKGVYVRRRFQFPTDVLMRENLLNTAFFLDNPLYYDPSHRNGTMSMIYLMMLAPVIGKKLAPPAIAASVTKGRVYDIKGHLRNIIFGIPGSLFGPLTIFIRRYLVKRKLPGVFLFNANNEYALHFHGEQIPSKNNRMELGEDGETLVIHYGYEDVDVNSVLRLHELLDAWLRRNNAGELIYWYPEEERFNRIRKQSRDGVHQVGTTRIANDPSRGVLDTDMRVWGTENLFVCSSSAFPTSGQANPTFLLAAFAVRLAHHLGTP